jgi:hypothetical protein
MSTTINIKDIPNHRVDESVLVMDKLFPFIYQFNFRILDEIVVSIHARPANCEPDIPNTIGVWRIKERH